MVISVDELGRKAYAEYRTGNWQATESLCREILSRQPRSELAAFLIGIMAAQRGEIRKSEEFLRQAIAFAPKSSRAYLHLANLLRQTGRWKEAEARYHDAIGLNPEDAIAHNDLGLVYLAQRRLPEAASCFQRAITLQPDFALAHYNLGLAYIAQSRDRDAITALRGAAKLAPGLAEAHSKLGNLLYENGHHMEAVDSFRRAAAAKPDSTLADMNLAKVHIHQQELAEAEACLRRAAGRDPRDSDVWRLLGMTLSQLGRFDDATTCLEKAITLRPTHISAYFDLAHAKKFTHSDLPRVEQMRALSSTPSLTDSEVATLHFALGKACDDLGQYGQAMAHFDEANRRGASRYSFDHAGYRASIDNTIARSSLDVPSSQSAPSAGSDLPVLVVGMMRSGTTLVEQILSSHPEIGAGGELPFWGETATRLNYPASELIIDAAKRHQISDEYIALLRRIAPAARRVTDKTPQNFLWLGLIHSIAPAARIIHCRRNPIDTCLSIYFTHFGVYKGFAYNRKNIVDYYMGYRRLMDHWRSVLPKDRFLDVDYEDLVANRERVSREMISFCGLEWSEACLRHENNDRAVKTASMWQVRQPIYTSSVERWRRYEPWLGEFDRLRPMC